MKNTLAIVSILGLLLLGCATGREGSMTIPPEVRNMSATDETLFHDVLTKQGGVAHADFVAYPRSKGRTLARIEVLTPYDNRQTGEERWFIEHNGGDTASYLVKLIPGGRAGTIFTVQRELAAANKGAQ
jgi:hypothetical protein